MIERAWQFGSDTITAEINRDAMDSTYCEECDKDAIYPCDSCGAALCGACYIVGGGICDACDEPETTE